MSKVNTTIIRGRRLNRRGLIILGVVGLVVVPGLIALKAYRDRKGAPALWREVNHQIEQKQFARALNYLDVYLRLNPDDLDALDMKAKVLAETAQDEHAILEAMPIHNQVLSRDPRRQTTRRRLLELNLKVRGRSQTAVAVARALVRMGDESAQAHRLLARALEGVGEEGDAQALAEAMREYEAAEAKAPGDVEGGERLAQLYRDKLDNPTKARDVLDKLVALNQGAPSQLAAAHLARSRFFAGGNEGQRAFEELNLALQADPADLDALLTAAEFATVRGDTATARRHLAAIPAARRDDLRIKLVEGLIDLRERRPDEAVQIWRSGLLQEGGNNVKLTWRLAQVLLDMGRVAEAEPLLSQYRRLIGGEEPNAWYRYLSALKQLKSNRAGAAIKELESIQFQNDRALEPHLYYLLGQCHEAARNQAKALEAYRQAGAKARDMPDPWIAIARLQWAEQPDEAIETLKLGLKAVPGDPRLLANLAQDLWRRQMQSPEDRRSWAEVDQVLELARRVAPNAVEVTLVQADYLMSVGKTDAVLSLLQAATSQSPKVGPLWLARANALSRLGRPADAAEVLDQAVAAAGPRYAFYVNRAATLLGLGHVKQARAALIAGRDHVPDEEKPLLWKALGDFAAGQNDPAAARAAYTQYARLQPDNAEPHAYLLDLALAADDEAAIHAEVEALKDVSGPNSRFWRLARVQELVRDRPPSRDGDKAAEEKRFEEAEGLVRDLKRDEPNLALAYVLDGRLKEKQHQVGPAIQAYERSVELGAGATALGPLIALVVREQRDDDLARIRKKVAALPPELNRLVVVQALKSGDKARAEQLAAQMVQGDPQGVDVRLWQAQVLNASGKTEQAEEVLTLLAAQQPTEPAPWLQLLMFQVANKQKAKAAATVEKVRAHVKTPRPELLWAQCYNAIENLTRADECYREALKKWPEDLAVRASVIGYCERTGRRPEAEASLRKVLKRDPALGWATRKLALLLASHPNDPAAWDEALSLIGPDPKPDDGPDDRFVRANVYARGPEPEQRAKAIPVLTELLIELPRSAKVHELLARSLLASGAVARAREHAAQAALADGATPDMILLFASTLLTTKEFDEADRQAARLAALDPDSLPVAELRARIAMARGQGQADAVAALERAFAGHVEARDAVSIGDRMIRLLMDLRQPDAAERVARKLAALNAQGKCLLAEFLARNVSARTDEAVTLVQTAAKTGNLRETSGVALTLAASPKADPRWLPLADQLLERALKVEPASTELLSRQALVRYLQGRCPEQIAIYEKLLAGKPGNLAFLNEMAWTLSEDLHQPDEGLKRINEAIEKLGPQPNMLDTRGVILTRLQRFDDAVKDLEKAAGILPTGPICYHLAHAYQKKGDLDNFRKWRDRARQAGLTLEQLQTSERDDWDKVMSN